MYLTYIRLFSACFSLIFPLSACLFSEDTFLFPTEAKCIDTPADQALLFIPTAQDTDCEKGDSASAHEKLICKHGGKVIVRTKTDTGKSHYKLYEPEEVHAFNKNTAFQHLPHSTGGVHDESLKRLDQAALDATSAMKIKPSPTLKRNKQIDYGPNGCGIWATAVCNRVLGLTGNSIVTQEEWDSIRNELGRLPRYFGITPYSLIASYYQRRGYCNHTEPFEGYRENYERIHKKIEDGCDLKILFSRKSRAWFSPWTYPHVEAIEDVVVPEDQNKDAYLVTNSWGLLAKVTGGTCTTFSHQFNKLFARSEGTTGVNFGDPEEFAWPPNDARIWIQSTCPCDKEPAAQEFHEKMSKQDGI